MDVESESTPLDHVTYEAQPQLVWEAQPQLVWELMPVRKHQQTARSAAKQHRLNGKKLAK